MKWSHPNQSDRSEGRILPGLVQMRLAGASQALILHIASETSKGDTVAVRGMGHCPNNKGYRRCNLFCRETSSYR